MVCRGLKLIVSYTKSARTREVRGEEGKGGVLIKYEYDAARRGVQPALFLVLLRHVYDSFHCKPRFDRNSATPTASIVASDR